MITNIINIGNSLGVRIPKLLLKESGLKGKVELKVKRGEIKITKPPADSKPDDTALLSEEALSDWERPEEDRAWASLQKEM